MAPDTDLPRADPLRLTLRWTRWMSLTARILATNILTLILMASGLFFLDSYRELLVAERMSGARVDAVLLADLLPLIEADERTAFLVNYADEKDARIRIYGPDGTRIIDSFIMSTPVYDIAREPETALRKRLARQLDTVINFLTSNAEPPQYIEPAHDNAVAWPELGLNSTTASKVVMRHAADATPVINAAARSPQGSYRVLLTTHPRDIRASVRSERSDVFLFFLFALIVSVLLSLFLASTIVHPLRHLARAATKVRLGRAREVAVPRLPERRDEIGLLARALSDMSNALRTRIDATEAFAADVAHEIKNPLASLRSALESLERVDDPQLARRLMTIAQDDVQRMDRLISDISEASRVDSQLSRAKFEPVDLGEMIEAVIETRRHLSDARERDVRIAFARPRRGIAVVMGEDMRLERVLNNLIDNAISFSPAGGLVEVLATTADDDVLIIVRDEGPGVPESEREAIFRRFHSARPDEEQFGKHSGLGLAIARTIIAGHQGSIEAGEREDGRQGAHFEIRLPRAGGGE